MLVIEIKSEEIFDQETQQFIEGETLRTLEFEHSLASLSKWESKYERPFLSKREMSGEEVYDYIVMMCQTPGVTAAEIKSLPAWVMPKINAYIDSDQSATKFAELPNRRVSGEKVTAELIYYWMVAFRIPWEAQHWHLNRLLALIRVCNSKQNGKQRRMSSHEIAQRNRDLNAERRAKYGTTG